jgi:hypothetical protein
MTVQLNQIHKGMNVFDSSGDKIGTVDWVKMTDEIPDTPQAEQITTQPGVTRDRTFVDNIAEAFSSDDVPEEVRERLLRDGFVRIDTDGIFSSDRYVLPEQIASVTDSDVIITKRRDELIKPL